MAGWFRIIAIAEALSWAGLLVGMYFRHVGSPQTEIGVKIFGPIHGGIFMAFLVGALLVGIARKWNVVTWVLALLGSIVPLGSVIFVIWADRTGRIGGRYRGCRQRRGRAKLGGVTRPRPSVGPALAGAFDLSALKQPPPPPPGAAAPAEVTGAVQVTEANLEAEVLVRSSEIPVVVLLWTPRSDASVQLGEALGALAAGRRRHRGRWRW